MARAPRLIYDADCGFCTKTATRLASRWRGNAELVAWQRMDAAELGALGLSAGDVQHAAWWVDEGGRLSRGHWAIAEAMVAAGGVRAGVGRVLRSGAVGWIALPAYRLVVSNRHRMPGGSVACRVDSPH